MKEVPVCLKSRIQSLLSGVISIFTDLHSIIPELYAEYLLYEQNCLEGTDIHLPEYPLESPANTLSAHVKSFVNLFAVCTFKNHVAGHVTFQFYRQILRIYQDLQILQKHLVFFRKFHFSSP